MDGNINARSNRKSDPGGQFVAGLQDTISGRTKDGKSAFAESLDLFLTRRFGTFTVASLLSSFGTWAQQVAEPRLLLDLTMSSLSPKRLDLAQDQLSEGSPSRLAVRFGFALDQGSVPAPA
jgi:hypothetical protein